MITDLSKLSRNYKENPLKRGELIPKEDLQYLFIDANLTLKQIASIINRHPNQIGKQCKQNNIVKYHKKSKEQSTQVSYTYDNIQELIQQKFNNVKCNYEYETFTFDFYIEDCQLFIDYHVDESHGGEPFCDHKFSHWQKLKLWADEAINTKYDNKQKNYYAHLINTWSVEDVLKRNTVSYNHLKYLEFFTHEELLDWLNNI